MDYIKMMEEKRAESTKKMNDIVDKAKAEERALSEEEQKMFDELDAACASFTESIAAAKKAVCGDATDDTAPEEEMACGDGTKEEKRAEEELKNFATYIRDTLKGEKRADANITKGDNGAVIPKTIANKIIDRVKDVCPIFKDAEQFNVKGTLAIPYVDSTTDNIAMAYADEFSELEAKNEKFLSVDLTGYLAGALAKISNSLVNNSDFDLVNFVVTKMGDAVAEFYEHEALIGTTGKALGLSTIGSDMTVTAASATAITTDEIIELKDRLKSTFQNGAYFVMNSTTLTALRKLKDGNGRYMLNDDITTDFGYTLLGKPVYVSDQMPAVAASAKAIYYLNPKQALAAKIVENMEIQVLKEKYATQHATGVVCWTEIDCKIQNAQAAACLTMKSA